MPRISRRIKRRSFYWLARRVARPLVLAYLDLYAGDFEEEDSGPVLDRDPHSTSVMGQFEVAGNVDHTTEIIYARQFGFTSARRANGDRTDPGAASAQGRAPGL